MDNSISVSQLNTYIKNVLQSEEFFHNIAIYGEISGYKFSGPHAYFTLKDKDSAIQCSCFYAAKTYVPKKDGESVIINGSIDYYPKTGKLSVIVNSIQPIGQGLLHIQLEQLKAKLEKEGLFDNRYKKPIPVFCKHICVVTSKTGAVIRDIVRTIRNKNKSINIDVYDVRVQGDDAAKTIIEALDIVDNLNYDCIIIARGGGSFEDLFCFNDEGLARKVFQLKTPCISAVGHETDFTICDFVSDSRAATPTAAAELVSYDQQQYYSGVADLITTMYKTLLHKVEYTSKTLQGSLVSISDKTLRICQKASSRLVNITQKLSFGLDNIIIKKDTQVKLLMTKIENDNPMRLLSNGYFRIMKNESNVASVADMIEGDNLVVYAKDGQADCEVKTIRFFQKENK